MKKTINLKLLAVLFTLACPFVLTSGSFVSADPQPAAAEQPISVTALCSDPQAGAAYWRIGNANPSQVVFGWVNPTTQAITNVTVPYGFTALTTSYDPTNTTPTVDFQQGSLPDQTMQINSQTCGQTVEGCVDGYTRDNLHLDWSPKGTVTITTADSSLLCDDVTVYLSDYTLPKSYDGSGIFDDSSVPQDKFASTSAVLLKGTSGGVTLTVPVPDDCTDYQLDAYYPPEITPVSYSGHGAQLIYGDIYLHSMTDCAKPPVGGSGGGVVEGASTTAPKSQVLADTGADTLFPALSALAIATCTIIVNFSLFAKLKALIVR